LSDAHDIALLPVNRLELVGHLRSCAVNTYLVRPLVRVV
jgi:hypothetical protein